MNTVEFFVRKNQLDSIELRETPETELQDKQVRLRIERFALTANNITYVAFGESMNSNIRFFRRFGINTK